MKIQINTNNEFLNTRHKDNYTLKNIRMGRQLGSPNQIKHWVCEMLDPTEPKKIIWSREFVSVNEMAKEMKETFTKVQIQSYVIGTRKTPKCFIFRRIGAVEVSINSCV